MRFQILKVLTFMLLLLNLASVTCNANAPLSRHTPLYNLTWNSVYFWDGRSMILKEQALEPITNFDEMNISIDDLLSQLKEVKGYRKPFEQVYGDDEITEERVGRALAAFMQ